jgi:glycosyltransferase involved in cell wall biosynthesis
MNQNKALFIGLVWPEPDSSAAGKRILQLVEFFQNRGDKVIFSSAASKTDYSFDFTSLRVAAERRAGRRAGSRSVTKQSVDSSFLGMTKEFQIQLNDSSFNEFLKTENPNIVVYDRFVSEEQFGWRVSQECPDALQILDTEDLHLLRFAREKAFKKKEEVNLYNEITIREIASILRSDLSLIISEYEMNLLQNEFNISPFLLHYLPFLEDIRHSEERGISEKISPFSATMDSAEMTKNFPERKDFVFIGNFLHEPNWQTVLHLKKNIWPKIKSKIPDAKLNIYGAYPSQKVWDLHNEKEGFWVHGRAGDALKVISEARILLAPLVFGAGQKGKFIDAMQAGTPVATNSIGAESMFGEIIPGIIEDDENQFIKKTIELYSNEKTWKKAQKNGFQILKEKFDKDLFESNLSSKIINLQSGLEKHRNRNFIGKILKSNTVNALKYMSLWIEAKNSK